jgi:hypothetical protein
VPYENLDGSIELGWRDPLSGKSLPKLPPRLLESEALFLPTALVDYILDSGIGLEPHPNNSSHEARGVSGRALFVSHLTGRTVAHNPL